MSTSSLQQRLIEATAPALDRSSTFVKTKTLKDAASYGDSNLPSAAVAIALRRGALFNAPRKMPPGQLPQLHTGGPDCTCPFCAWSTGMSPSVWRPVHKVESGMQTMSAWEAEGLEPDDPNQIAIAMSHCRFRELAPYMSMWKRHTYEVVRLRKTAQRVLRRWLHQSLVMTFDAWAEKTEETKRMKKTCSKVITMMTKKSMFLTFMAWKEHMKEKSRQDQVMKKVLLRWTQSSLASALELWSLRIYQRKHGKDIMKRFVYTWQNMNFVQAFQNWADYTQEVLLDRQERQNAAVPAPWKPPRIKYPYQVKVRIGPIRQALGGVQLQLSLFGARTSSDHRNLVFWEPSMRDFTAPFDVMAKLGPLMSIRIGHSGKGSLAFFLESVQVIDLITGNTHMFPCGQWLDSAGESEVTLLRQGPTRQVCQPTSLPKNVKLAVRAMNAAAAKSKLQSLVSWLEKGTMPNRILHIEKSVDGSAADVYIRLETVGSDTAISSVKLVGSLCSRVNRNREHIKKITAALFITAHVRMIETRHRMVQFRQASTFLWTRFAMPFWRCDWLEQRSKGFALSKYARSATVVREIYRREKGGKMLLKALLRAQGGKCWRRFQHGKTRLRCHIHMTPHRFDLWRQRCSASELQGIIRRNIARSVYHKNLQASLDLVWKARANRVTRAVRLALLRWASAVERLQGHLRRSLRQPVNQEIRRRAQHALEIAEQQRKDYEELQAIIQEQRQAQEAEEDRLRKEKEEEWLNIQHEQFSPKSANNSLNLSGIRPSSADSQDEDGFGAARHDKHGAGIPRIDMSAVQQGRLAHPGRSGAQTERIGMPSGKSRDESALEEFLIAQRSLRQSHEQLGGVRLKVTSSRAHTGRPTDIRTSLRQAFVDPQQQVADKYLGQTPRVPDGPRSGRPGRQSVRSRQLSSQAATAAAAATFAYSSARPNGGRVLPQQPATAKSQASTMRMSRKGREESGPARSRRKLGGSRTSEGLPSTVGPASPRGSAMTAARALRN